LLLACVGTPTGAWWPPFYLETYMRIADFRLSLPRAKHDLECTKNYDKVPHDVFTVNSLSCLQNRRAVWKLALYFRREFGYDTAPWGYEGKYVDDEAIAYMFTLSDIYSDKEDWRQPEYGFGAVGFRWRRWTDAPHGWALQWAWIHPYQRNRGNLSKLWPSLKKLHGDFHVEPPLSAAMKRFIESQDAKEAKSDHTNELGGLTACAGGTP